MNEEYSITPEVEAFLDRIDARRATTYFWVEQGTERGLREFHWLPDCAHQKCEVAWGSKVVTSAEPPPNAWWPGDRDPGVHARFLCRICQNYEPSPELHPLPVEHEPCAVCGCARDMHGDPLRSMFDRGCGMAWLDTYDSLAYGGTRLHHCRCNGYRPETV